mmetsp:Transcript_5399/g.17943  ORF Transcript_5399/g.17943 Transcript_5399/m.17943 type:complete len:277 (-) Transcript_5399:109-939(-)
MLAASAGEMPNARLSNRSAPVMNPPCIAAAGNAPAEPSPRLLSNQRVAGGRPTASAEALSLCHTAANASSPPGQCAATPHKVRLVDVGAMACGSSRSAVIRVVLFPQSCSITCADIWRTDGWSNTRVGASNKPVSLPMWLAASVAPSESMPASMSGVPALSSPDPVRSRTTESSAVSTCDCRADGLMPCKRAPISLTASTGLVSTGRSLSSWMLGSSVKSWRNGSGTPWRSMDSWSGAIHVGTPHNSVARLAERRSCTMHDMKSASEMTSAPSCAD